MEYLFVETKKLGFSLALGPPFKFKSSENADSNDDRELPGGLSEVPSAKHRVGGVEPTLHHARLSGPAAGRQEVIYTPRSPPSCVGDQPRRRRDRTFLMRA